MDSFVEDITKEIEKESTRKSIQRLIYQFFVSVLKPFKTAIIAFVSILAILIVLQILTLVLVLNQNNVFKSTF